MSPTYHNLAQPLEGILDGTINTITWKMENLNESYQTQKTGLFRRVKIELTISNNLIPTEAESSLLASI